MCAVPRFYEKVYAAVLSRAAGRAAAAPGAVQLGRRGGSPGRRLPQGPPPAAARPPALARRRRRAGPEEAPRHRRRADQVLPVRRRAAVPRDRGVLLRVRHLHPPRLRPHRDHRDRVLPRGPPLPLRHGRDAVMPGVEVRIGENDEIQVRGKTVMKGYYKKPEATAEVFVDGWFRTGDAGTVDADGYIVITDRIKDLIKTSGGKYIAPEMIESNIGSDPLIEQVAVIGDERRFVSALLVPSFLALEPWAGARVCDDVARGADPPARGRRPLPVAHRRAQQRRWPATSRSASSPCWPGSSPSRAARSRRRSRSSGRRSRRSTATSSTPCTPDRSTTSPVVVPDHPEQRRRSNLVAPAVIPRSEATEAIPSRLEGQLHGLPPVTDQGPSPHMALGARPPVGPRPREAGRRLLRRDRTARSARPSATPSPRLGPRIPHRALARPVTRSLRRDGPRTPGAGLLPHPPSHPAPVPHPPKGTGITYHSCSRASLGLKAQRPRRHPTAG